MVVSFYVRTNSLYIVNKKLNTIRFVLTSLDEVQIRNMLFNLTDLPDSTLAKTETRNVVERRKSEKG
jgi:hypothetical protein